MKNKASVTEFILMRFTTNNNMYLLHSVLFSFIYLWALMGNGLIIMITTLDQHLYTPMYFFLKNLSFLDLWLISITIPKYIINSLTHNSSISFFGCVAQVLLVVLLAAAELFLLTAMSFDHYAAICHPLHYEVIMNMGTCMQTVALSWLGGSLSAVMHKVGTFSLSFCGSMWAISSSVTYHSYELFLVQKIYYQKLCPSLLVCFWIASVLFLSPFPICTSSPLSEDSINRRLVKSLLHLSSSPGGCCIISLYWLHWSSKTNFKVPSISDPVISIIYTMVPLTLNPIIYSLRNKPMKLAVGMLIKGKLIKK